MRAKISYLCLGLVLAAGTCAAQQNTPRVPDYSSVYCAGIVTNKSVPHDTYLISGEESNVKMTFSERDLVYLNRGSAQGVKEGDQYSIVRPVRDEMRVPWNRYLAKLSHAMGTQYQDAGRVRVVHVLPKTSIAAVVFACNYMRRGDIARPFEERPAPPLKQDPSLDIFAPVSGRPVGMVVTARDFFIEAGAGQIVYVNLGSAQSSKVGDYIRAFRYQGTHADYVYQTIGFEYKMYGFGSSPVRYTWADLPREILGEGVVLSVSHNASTVLLTNTRRTVYAGDYIELE
ncbi:MAG TPA: hypothetical protein VF860_08340 [Candidatus Acidoferrales bacterium]